MNVIYTIGHSNQTLDAFMALLLQHGISALADVRSKPHSKYVPHFSRDALKTAVEAAGIAYVFLGRELGARPDDPTCYVDGKISYEKLATRPEFSAGLQRLREGSGRHRIALMCAEKDPAQCHRGLLIAPELLQNQMQVFHILADGSLETHAALETRLNRNEKGPTPDLFS